MSMYYCTVHLERCQISPLALYAQLEKAETATCGIQILLLPMKMNVSHTYSKMKIHCGEEVTQIGKLVATVYAVVTVLGLSQILSKPLQIQLILSIWLEMPRVGDSGDSHTVLSGPASKPCKTCCLIVPEDSNCLNRLRLNVRPNGANNPQRMALDRSNQPKYRKTQKRDEPQQLHIAFSYVGRQKSGALSKLFHAQIKNDGQRKRQYPISWTRKR
mmetsp:Transcript_28153/g.49913  ORF Transcript_28153/g.49913 Transcript_28153/m.49913 type:complete len:216 (+) Transcript_28153:3-650(+)